MSQGPSRTPTAAVLVSGGGRSLENLAQHFAAGDPPGRVGLVVSNKADVGALERARRLGLTARVIPHGDYETPAAFSRAVFDAVEAAGCDLVVLAGFLRLLLIPDHWLGRVINIHPALLPAHGGKGLYGERVHRSVLAAGDAKSGCTVHYVTNEYDAGPIILQREVPVLPDDTAERLATRVFAEECRALPEAVRQHATGKAATLGRGP